MTEFSTAAWFLLDWRARETRQADDVVCQIGKTSFSRTVKLEIRLEVTRFSSIVRKGEDRCPRLSTFDAGERVSSQRETVPSRQPTLSSTEEMCTRAVSTSEFDDTCDGAAQIALTTVFHHRSPQV